MSWVGALTLRKKSGRDASEDPLDLLFSALSDRTRRQLLARLALGPAMVTDLARPFRMSLPAISKHLRVLEKAHLVSRVIDGRVHRLSLKGGPLEQVEVWLDPFRSYWEGSLSGLRRDLEEHPSRRSRGRGSAPSSP
jgi:DNA-binding transcriptional ArsR family regulator